MSMRRPYGRRQSRVSLDPWFGAAERFQGRTEGEVSVRCPPEWEVPLGTFIGYPWSGKLGRGYPSRVEAEARMEMMWGREQRRTAGLPSPSEYISTPAATASCFWSSFPLLQNNSRVVTWSQLVSKYYYLPILGLHISFCFFFFTVLLFCLCRFPRQPLELDCSYLTLVQRSTSTSTIFPGGGTFHASRKPTAFGILG